MQDTITYILIAIAALIVISRICRSITSKHSTCRKDKQDAGCEGCGIADCPLRTYNGDKIEGKNE